MHLLFIVFFVVTALLVPDSAHAYIGPGIGAGTLGVVLGFIVSIFLAIVAIIWYPLKRIFKRSDKKKIENENNK